MPLRESYRVPSHRDVPVTPAALLSNTTGHSFPDSTNHTTPALISDPFCEWILYTGILQSRVRIWDVIIIIPNFVFLLFLIIKCRSAIRKLHTTTSPIFTAFYGMVCAVAIISVLRCIVSMTVDATLPAGDVTDKVLWLVLRFFLLATELSVIIFGLAFGHLDSQTSIRRVLFMTSLIALTYSVTQGTLEFLYPTDFGHTKSPYDLFGHGGMLFWFATSVFLFVIYTAITILPFTKLRHRFALPSKRSFYYYAAFLAVLNSAQAVGSGMLNYHMFDGLCVVDVTTYLYFTCFAPLVYITFLKDFFKVVEPSILFSYKHQVDESQEEDVHVNLHHQSSSSGKLDSDNNIESNYDSTPFDSLSPAYNSVNSGPNLSSFDSNYFAANSPSINVPT